MSWMRRARNVIWPGRLRRDIEREMSFHLREREDELREEGVGADEAARRARRQFGGYSLQLERTRDMDVSVRLEAIVLNLVHAARALRKAPAFTITVLATLALGIGANTAVFSAIDAVLLRPLPFPEAGRLVRVAQAHPRITHPALAPVRLQEWDRLNHTFEAITGYYFEDVSELSGEFPERLVRALVAPHFLRVWGIGPALGRDFTAREQQFGGPGAVIISDRLWRRRFDADPNAVGKTLRMGSTLYTIVGVMPEPFFFPVRDVDVWSPSPMDAPYAQSREATWFNAIGRLKAGVTPSEARADLAAVQAALAREHPKTDAELTPDVQPLKESTIAGAGRPLWILFGSVTVLLLIACINVAALLLSRATGRRAELALRVSLGASRSSVAACLLTEVFLLALGGAVLGLLVASSASGVFRALAADLPRVEEIAIDWRIALYTLACTVAVTLAAGLVPAVHAARQDLAVRFADAGRWQVAGRRPAQLVLVGAQVALSVALLAGAGLLLRSFQELTRVSPGFDPERVLTFLVSTTWGETSDQEVARQRSDRILEALRSLPGVSEAATSTQSLPGVPTEYEVEYQLEEGRAETEPKMLAQGRWVSPSYFATVRIPVLGGETCRDDPDNPTVMVNRRFAETYLRGQAVVDRRLLRTAFPALKPGRISGIVGDAREMGVDRDPAPTVYWCSSASQPGTYFLLRTAADPRLMMETVRRRVHDVEPLRSVYNLTPLDEHISDAYAQTRMRTILLAFFALTAVSLASVGLYGTLAYMVNVRRREIALRQAVGARRAQVVRQFLGQGLRVSLAGIVVGLALSAGSARLLSGMLFGVSAQDPPTLAAVTLAVLAVSALASLAPAIRAARLDPMRVLRDE